MPTDLHLLCIEASEDNVAVALDELKRQDYRIVHRRVDTAAALQAALDEGTWDLILSDDGLPGVSGVAALEICRTRAPEVPFLFFSANASQVAAVAALRRGARDFIPKDHACRLAPAIQRELALAAARRAERAAAHALAESERKYRALVEGLLQGTLIVQDGRIADANTAATWRLGSAGPVGMAGLAAGRVPATMRLSAFSETFPARISSSTPFLPTMHGVMKP